VYVRTYVCICARARTYTHTHTHTKRDRQFAKFICKVFKFEYMYICVCLGAQTLRTKRRLKIVLKY